MSDIPEERKIIQIEETKPQAAVTESMMTRVGATANFISKRHMYIKEFCLNGKYNIFTSNPSIDGFLTYPFPFELIDTIVKIGPVNGTSGTTEIDLKWKPEASGTFQSLFSTTPKWTSAAAADSTIRTGTTATGWTAPVISKTLFDAYDIIKLDQIQAQLGPVNSYFITCFIRPR